MGIRQIIIPGDIATVFTFKITAFIHQGDTKHVLFFAIADVNIILKPLQEFFLRRKGGVFFGNRNDVAAQYRRPFPPFCAVLLSAPGKFQGIAV
jgi:hypothetical protein